jgi:GGDEF domain-containing protein
MLTTVLCMATLMAFLAVFAQNSYRRATVLHQQRSQLRNKLEEIRALKDRLTEQAERDPLTGLLNRRMLEDSLPRLLESCRLRQTSLALMLLDVDFFKQTNDRHGHAAGDQLLQSLARHLQHSCRSQDMVFRYGGDEFLVLFPDTPIEAAGACPDAAPGICRQPAAAGAPYGACHVVVRAGGVSRPCRPGQGLDGACGRCALSGQGPGAQPRGGVCRMPAGCAHSLHRAISAGSPATAEMKKPRRAGPRPGKGGRLAWRMLRRQATVMAFSAFSVWPPSSFQWKCSVPLWRARKVNSM